MAAIADKTSFPGYIMRIELAALEFYRGVYRLWYISLGT
jgi:hypothetical protein